jgi:diguanylate cyclase (GGDEF)-like protein
MLHFLQARPRRARRRPRPAPIWWVHLALGALLVFYFATLVVRPADQRSIWLDGWAVAGFELVVCAVALSRSVVRGAGRGVPLALGAAMVSWSLGDVVLTYESLGGATPPVPSAADAFYVGFYPLAFLGLALLMRRSRPNPATWLDGAVAGLGAAAVCSAFAFHSIAHLVGGDAAAVATNLAYPVGDALLLAMVAGGSALLTASRKTPWALVAAGCAVNAAGDTFNLFHSAGAAHVGGVVDGIAWPAALLLMSAAVWVPAGSPDLVADAPVPGFVLPGLGATCGLAVLLVGSSRPVDGVAVGLAAATLAIVGVRLRISVGALRSLTEQRRQQAHTDQLTGLANRRRLTAVLETFFAGESQARPAGLAFLYLDLDRFKEINDSFGHAVGDALLRQVGPRIRSAVEGSSLVARIGGDELAVVLVGSDADQAAIVAKRICVAMREPFLLDDVSLRIGTSIGIAVAPGDARTPEALMRCADEAMYRAKQAGGGVAVYDIEQDSHADRLALVEDLREAIAADALELHFQPQVDLRTGETTGVEALLRWHHAERGFVPPLEFLPLAEHAGLMRALTSLVLDKAFIQARRWSEQGQSTAVSVNVSATNIVDSRFCDLVRERLAAHDLPAGTLVLEITETTLISDFDRCRAVVDELRGLGCTVSIDDFGAGYTSLPLLSRLRVCEVKLDRRFLSELGAERNQALVRATIGLAHSLGLTVVAEGVEDGTTLELLRRLGCDIAQGYHLGRPQPASMLDLGGRRAA